MALLALCLIASAILVTTSCSGFGKDDFYGTWNSGDFVLDTGANAGTTANVTFYFSGTSENLINGGSAMFYEEYTRYKTDGSVAVHNFWWGNYKLSDNSGVETGDLTLRYFYGYNLNASGAKSVDDLIAIVTGDDPANAFESIATTDQYAVDTKHCSDVEKFSFSLGDRDFFKGYQSMTATSISQWSEFTTSETADSVGVCAQTNPLSAYTKDSPCDGTSWGAKDTSRTFTLTNDNGSDSGLQNPDSLSGNRISLPVSTVTDPSAIYEK